MNKNFLQFFKFGIVGLLNTIIAYAVYAGLVYIGIPYIISNIASFLSGILNSYFWNNRYVFKKKDDEQRNHFYTFFKTALTYAATGLVLNNILLVIFVEYFSISKYISYILAVSITYPINFIINKYWAYKISKRKADDFNANNRF